MTTAKEVALASMTLLKNDGKALPLKRSDYVGKAGSLAVVGR
jgi:hypothetical protein